MVIDDTEIVVERKNIKHMYIRIKSDGTIKVTAPQKIKDDIIRNFVSSKSDWIIKNEEAVSKRQASDPRKNNYSHLDLWGETYPIEIVITNGKPHIEKTDSLILFYLNDLDDDITKEKLLNNWYRNLLKKEVTAVFADSEKLVGVKANEWHIKNMKTKWGSCNIKDKRIWLNLQLATKPLICLDYVIIHELTHLKERGHNSVFKSYMDQYCPNWRQIKKLLNS